MVGFGRIYPFIILVFVFCHFTAKQRAFLLYSYFLLMVLVSVLQMKTKKKILDLWSYNLKRVTFLFSHFITTDI